MEARAQHQFLGTEADELAFQAGDLLKVRPRALPPLLLSSLERSENVLLGVGVVHYTD